MSPALISLVPQDVDLALYAGDGAGLRLTVRNAAGAPLDVTGDVTAQVREFREDSFVSAEFAVDLTDAATGVVTLTLTGAQTAGLLGGSPGPYKGAWDVQWTATGAEPVTLVQGAVTCELDVTRS